MALPIDWYNRALEFSSRKFSMLSILARIISKLLVWSKTKKGAQQCFKHLIQIHFYLLVYGSWDCIHIRHSCFLFCFLHVVNYKSVNWVPLSTDWFWRKNLKTFWAGLGMTHPSPIQIKIREAWASSEKPTLR